jgi:hypothetical protein
MLFYINDIFSSHYKNIPIAPPSRAIVKSAKPPWTDKCLLASDFAVAVPEAAADVMVSDPGCDVAVD